jgi:hypothetical protein
MDTGLRRNDGEAKGRLRTGMASLLISLNMSGEKCGMFQGANPNVAIFQAS